MARHPILTQARRARGLREIREAGYAAQVQGLPITDCPFRSWEPGYASWRSGWHDAEERAIEHANPEREAR